MGGNNTDTDERLSATDYQLFRLHWSWFTAFWLALVILVIYWHYKRFRRSCCNRRLTFVMIWHVLPFYICSVMFCLMDDMPSPWKQLAINANYCLNLTYAGWNLMLAAVVIFYYIHLGRLLKKSGSHLVGSAIVPTGFRLRYDIAWITMLLLSELIIIFAWLLAVCIISRRLPFDQSTHENMTCLFLQWTFIHVLSFRSLHLSEAPLYYLVSGGVLHVRLERRQCLDGHTCLATSKAEHVNGAAVPPGTVVAIIDSYDQLPQWARNKLNIGSQLLDFPA